MVWNEYQEYLIDRLNLKSFYENSHQVGNSRLNSNIYSSEYILKSRETYIHEENSFIYNNIVYPKTGKNLPCLGIDLMCFSEKKVIIVFDFQHPKENHDFDHQIVQSHMGEMSNNTSKGIRFFEPGNHFSRYIYVRNCTVNEIPEHLRNFKKYVDTFNLLINHSKPVGEDVKDYEDFDTYMHRLDPVSGYLTSKFGKEFSEEYISKFLFSYSKLAR